MSLATRCVSCGTVFRVVQDQLKVSEGWVRCGRCNEVFNALENLFDLERDAPPGWTPPTPPASGGGRNPSAVPGSAAAQTSSAFAFPSDDDIISLDEDDRIHSRFFQPEQDDVVQSPADLVSERDRMEFADAQFNDDDLSDAGFTHPDPLLESATLGARAKRSWLSAWRRPKAPARRHTRVPRPQYRANFRQSPEAEADEPEFIRRAKQAARWQSPGVRVALGAAAAFLLVTLLAQLALHERDVVAARWPSTHGALVAVCGWMDCHIEAPRRINDITVESSALAPANGGAAYRLSLLLRNRGSLPVAMPSIDLSLTDSAGQLIARRALSPAEFQGPSSVIPADAEAPLQVLLSSNGPRLSGYTVEVFYP